jgi:guanine deaminase
MRDLFVTREPRRRLRDGSAKRPHPEVSSMYRLRTRALWAESNDRLQWLPDAVIAWGEDGAISSVAPWSGQVVDEDARDALLTPGFVDAHVHYPQTRIIGAASGPLLDWLARSTFPEEQRFADPAHAGAVAARFVGSLARAGTTCMPRPPTPCSPPLTPPACA